MMPSVFVRGTAAGRVLIVAVQIDEQADRRHLSPERLPARIRCGGGSQVRCAQRMVFVASSPVTKQADGICVAAARRLLRNVIDVVTDHIQEGTDRRIAAGTEHLAQHALVVVPIVARVVDVGTDREMGSRALGVVDASVLIVTAEVDEHSQSPPEPGGLTENAAIVGIVARAIDQRSNAAREALAVQAVGARPYPHPCTSDTSCDLVCEDGKVIARPFSSSYA